MATNYVMQHAHIIRMAGIANLAAITKAKPRTVKGWRERDRIPVWFWGAIIDSGVATIDQLIDGAGERIK